MSGFKWLIGGLVGGAIGAAIWVAVGYGTGYELGWIAWVVGLMVAAGVRVAAGEHEVGPGPGFVAAVTAVVVVVAAKFIVVHLLVANAFSEMPEVQVTDEDMTAAYATQLAEEIEAGGGTVAWPPTAQNEDAPARTRFPQDLWAKAQAKWQAVPPDQKEAERAAKKEEIEGLRDEFVGALTGNVRDEAFKASFSPYDLLWFGLAAFTAFKLGSGLASDD